jgi:hypothetical protein
LKRNETKQKAYRHLRSVDLVCRRRVRCAFGNASAAAGGHGEILRQVDAVNREALLFVFHCSIVCLCEEGVLS